MFSIKNSNIALIGLGLMGGSLALALKGRCARLGALEPHQATRELALRQTIVDVADGDPVKILTDADLVILAAPVTAILAWLPRLAEYIQHPCIVLDIGSTKRAIVAAMESLPAHLDPIGGHPICGRERLSLENAERTLYRDAPFVLTPLARTTERAKLAALQIAETLGARSIILDAESHDRLLASTSHLPYLLASALALVTPGAAPLIGPGFRSTGRVAGTPASMMLSVIQSNRDNILVALHRLQNELGLFESALVNNDLAQIESLLNAARAKYQSLTQ
jgi:prephenate dehydrogenase